MAGLLGQLGRPLVSLITLPVLIGYLGQDGLGVWMVALSMMGLVGFVSTGMSSSVITLIGRASGNSSDLHGLVSAAVFVAVIWGLVVVLLAVPAVLMLDWTSLLKLHSASLGADLRQLIVALALLLAFGFVAVVPRQVMVGRMHGYLAHLLDLSGVVIGAVALIAAIWLRAPLWVLGMAFMAPSYLLFLAAGLIYLHRSGISVGAKHFDMATFSTLARDSIRMAGYQSAYAVSSQSDLLLIGIILGAPASAVYGVAQRVFSLPVLLSATVNYAQWPAMARADAAGDTQLVAQMFRYTLAIGTGAALSASIVIALNYDSLMNLWLGHTLKAEPSVLIGMVVWVTVATMTNTCDSVLRAQNETMLLMRAMMLMAVINIAVTVLLLHWIGAAGAIWGSVAGFTLALLLPYGLKLRATLA